MLLPGDLAGINDVDSGDYTGFSLLGEDLLGDLFGESSNKKKSNKNKKKQAPVLSTTTTTTTKRPKPNRRPSRKPSSKATTVRPTRSTTVKVRPSGGNRRTTRKPSRRPNRPNKRPTTTALTENSIPSSFYTSTMTTSAPTIVSSATSPISTTISPQPIASDETFQPVVIVTQRPHFTMSTPTEKPEANFEDPGLEMSLAHITGQLSAMPETSIISEGAKDTGIMSTIHDQAQTAYEKIETITPKGTTVSFPTSSEKRVNGEMIKIVQNLDSTSEEKVPEEEKMTAEQTRTTHFQDDSYVAMIPPRQNRNSDFSLEDLDILGLDKIGETVGDQLGLFGRRKRQHKHKDTKVHGENYEIDNYDVLGLETIGETVGDQLGLFERNKRQNKHSQSGTISHEEYDDDMLGLDTIGESLGIERSDKKNKNRRRQNKMMRGEWSRA